jgi:hypothetical protein
MPLKSLEGARNKIRTMCDLNDNIVVKIRAGTYFRTTPFLLTGNQDSGRPTSGTCANPASSDFYTITYTKENASDDVTIHGGLRPRSNWHIVGQYPANTFTIRAQNLYSQDVAAYPSRDLYYKNVRMTRARYPNVDQGFMKIQKRVVTTCNSGTTCTGYNFAMPWLNPVTYMPLFPLGECKVTDGQTEVVARRNWTIARGVVSETCTSTSNCNAGTPCQDPTMTCTTMYFTDNHRLGVRDSHPNYNLIGIHECDYAYLENRLSFLDSAYEWYFDEASGILYVATPNDEPGGFNGAGFVYPVAPRLVVMDEVHDVVFDGLNFAFTHMPLPSSGYRTTQSGYGVEYCYTANDNLADCPSLASCDTQGTRKWIVPGAVQISDSVRCDVLNCRIAHIGGSGIEIDGNHCWIYGNKIFDIGGSAVAIIDPCNVEAAPYCYGIAQLSGNEISYNNIDSTGRSWHDCASILTANVVNTLIEKNTIYDNYWSGIALGGNFGYIDLGSNYNRIWRNDISYVARWLIDGGGIYVRGRQMWPIGLPFPKNSPLTSDMFANHVHDISLDAPFTGNCDGVAFDEGSVGWRVRSNIFTDCENTYGFNTLCPGANSPACPSLQEWPQDYPSYTYGWGATGCPDCDKCDSYQGYWNTCPQSWECELACANNCQFPAPTVWPGIVSHVSQQTVQGLIDLAGPGPGNWVWTVFSPGVDPY